MDFLPGVPAELILARMEQSKGNELAGKFFSPDSSSFLAANTFGWFIERTNLFPLLPTMANGQPVREIHIEYEARLPWWPRGTHPQLDAVALTAAQLVGVEAKRLEPFRDKKSYDLSPAYDRPLWSDAMEPISATCRALRDGSLRYKHLDATQLVKHAFGLSSHAQKLGLAPALVYLFAEPAALHGRPIPPEQFALHRREIDDFAERIAGAEVSFAAISYRDWISEWKEDHATTQHGDAILARFQP